MTKFIFYLISFYLCIPSLTQGQVTGQFVRPKIQGVIEKLRKESTMHLGLPVGYSGLPEKSNKYYKLYHRLTETATNEELVALTNDSSKNIVLYAFSILAGKDYSGLKNIFERHLTDTTLVWIASGCTGTCSRVNQFMLSNLNPKYPRTCIPYLTQEQFDKYNKDLAETSPDN